MELVNVFEVLVGTHSLLENFGKGSQRRTSTNEYLKKTDKHHTSTIQVPYEYHKNATLWTEDCLQPTLSLAGAAGPFGWPYEYHQIEAASRLQPTMSLASAEPCGWPHECHQI